MPPRRLAFFICCLALAFCCCVFLWTFSELVARSIHDTFHRPAPTLTDFCLDYRAAILLFPLPWFVAAVRHGVQRRATPVQLVLFAATLILSLLCLTVFLLLAFALPWLPMNI